MTDLAQAVATQMANIEKRTGKSLAELTAIVQASGLAKHGEKVAMLKQQLGMGHGDANTLVHMVMQSHGDALAAGKSDADALDAIYSGAKAGLRPMHDAILKVISSFGPFENAPKKTYVSLRRSKQFATIGPATKDKIEIGFNMKGVDATDRLLAIPPGGMCSYKTRLGTTAELDDDLVQWLRTAYDASA